MIKYHILLPLLGVMTWVFLFSVSAVLSADDATMTIGKRAQVRLASKTQVGNLTLAPGTYRIQHRVDGATHLLRFTELKRLYKPAVVVERHRGNVECRFETLPGKIERTTIDTTEGSDVPRITKIQIKGENVAHLF